MADLKATAILSAEDRASAVLAMVSRNFDKLSRAADQIHARDSRVGQVNAMNGALERRASILSRLGNGASSAIGLIPGVYAGGGMLAGAAALSAAAIAASKAAAENQRAMTRIAITGDGSKDQQDQAALEVDRLAAKTRLAQKDVREGLDSLVAAGRSLPDAMKFLPSVANTAQAAGAEVKDIANAADAAGNHLGITSQNMQAAFDIMAAGGKAGKFELKDMARYLAEIAPMAKKAGMQGTGGLADLVSAFQMVRKEAGTSEEAATNLKNVFSKMYSEETGNKFKEAGIDLRKRLDAAEAKGENLLETFVKITAEATKSGKVKLPELFQDMQAQQGMSALLNNLKEWKSLSGDIAKNSGGTVGRDLERVLKDTQAGFDGVAQAAGRLWRNLGNNVPASGALEAVTRKVNELNDALEKNAEIERKLKDAGVKPIEKTKTPAERQAEEILSGKTPETASPSRKDEYGDWVPKGLAPDDYARRAFEARARYAQQLEDEDRRTRQRGRASERADAAAIASGGGAYGDAMASVADQKRIQRAQGDTWGKLEDISGPMAQRVASILTGFAYNQQRVGEGKPGFSEGEKASRMGDLRALVGELLDIRRQQTGGNAPSEGEVTAAVNALVKAAQGLGEGGAEGKTITADTIRNALGDGIKAEVKPDQITAKSEVSVNGGIKVEVSPSSSLIAIVKRAESISVSGAQGGNVSIDGQVNP